MSHESWVVKLCIFHKVIDVLLIKMLLSHLFDRSNKARKVSNFLVLHFKWSYISLSVTWQTRLLPRFWLGTGKSKRSFHRCFPHFRSRMDRGGQTKQRFTSNKKQLKSLRGWWRVEKKHSSISNILSGIHVFISWCFITHLKQFPAISRLFIQIKIFLDNIMSFWDAHQAATT